MPIGHFSGKGLPPTLLLVPLDDAVILGRWWRRSGVLLALELAPALEPDPGALVEGRRFRFFTVDSEEMFVLGRGGRDDSSRKRLQPVAAELRPVEEHEQQPRPGDGGRKTVSVCPFSESGSAANIRRT